MKTRVDTSELEDSLGLFFELKKLYILFNCIFKYICVHIYIHTHTYIIYNFGKKIPSPAGMHGHFGFFLILKMALEIIWNVLKYILPQKLNN